MKLYTEKQVVYAISIAFDIEPHIKVKDILRELTPIELPSDEEIKEYINSTPYYGHCTGEYCEGIEDGIKWMRDKIQGDNK